MATEARRFSRLKQAAPAVVAAIALAASAAACSDGPSPTPTDRIPASPSPTTPRPVEPEVLKSPALETCFDRAIVEFHDRVNAGLPVQEARGVEIFRAADDPTIGRGTEVIRNSYLTTCVENGRQVLLLISGFPSRNSSGQIVLNVNDQQSAVIDFDVNGNPLLRGAREGDILVNRHGDITPNYRGESVRIPLERQVTAEAFRAIGQDGVQHPALQARFFPNETPQQAKGRFD